MNLLLKGSELPGGKGLDTDKLVIMTPSGTKSQAMLFLA